MAANRRSPAPLPPLPLAGVPPHRRLWELRMERGLSQASVAALAGLKKETVGRIERGQTQMPEAATLAKLAAVFGMSLDELRRRIGMHGPLHLVPPRQPEAPQERQVSPAAAEIARLVDTLPVEEREYILALCRLLYHRRGLHLPADMQRIG